MWFKKFLPTREYTEAEFYLKFAEILGDVESKDIVPEAVTQIFNDVSMVDGFSEYLKDTLKNDLHRSFAAQNDRERDIIRGGFSRTAYILGKLLDRDRV